MSTDPGEILDRVTAALEAACRAGEVVPVYFRDALPRGAVAVDRDENQLGSGYLLDNLARLAVLARGDGGATLPPSSTAR